MTAPNIEGTRNPQSITSGDFGPSEAVGDLHVSGALSVDGIFSAAAQTNTTIVASVSVQTPILQSGTGTLTLKGGTTTAAVVTGANVVFSGTIKPAASGYLSSDGTVGLTQVSTSTTGKSITVKDGLIVAFA